MKFSCKTVALGIESSMNGISFCMPNSNHFISALWKRRVPPKTFIIFLHFTHDNFNMRKNKPSSVNTFTIVHPLTSVPTNPIHFLFFLVYLPPNWRWLTFLLVKTSPSIFITLCTSIPNPLGILVHRVLSCSWIYPVLTLLALFFVLSKDSSFSHSKKTSLTAHIFFINTLHCLPLLLIEILKKMLFTHCPPFTFYFQIMLSQCPSLKKLINCFLITQPIGLFLLL